MSPVPRKIDSLKKFAIVYGTVFSKNEKKNILDFCKKKNLLLISLGYRNKWVNNNITYVDPTQFIHFLKKAEIVFTSMFHGVMLSFKLKKQFWCTIDPIRRNKLSFFLDYLELSSRIISDFSNFENKLDYSDREKKYLDWVVSSKEYLIDSINQSRFLKENK